MSIREKQPKKDTKKAYVRDGEKWTEWSDENSNEIRWEEVQKKQAYILIWEKIENASSEKCSVNKIVETENTSTKENDDAIRIEMEFLKSPQKMIWKPKESNEMEIDCKGKKRRREEDRNIMLEPIETVTTKSEKRMKLKNKSEKNEESEYEKQEEKRRMSKEVPDIRRSISESSGGEAEFVEDEVVVEEAKLKVMNAKDWTDSDKRRHNKEPGTKMDVDEKKSERLDWRELKEIVANQEKKLRDRTNEVNELNIENLELKARIRALESKIKKREDEEDRENWKDTDERSENDAHAQSREGLDRVAHMRRERNNQDRENLQSYTESGKRRRIEESRILNELNDMEVEEDSEWNSRTNDNVQRTKEFMEIPHKSYL